MTSEEKLVILEGAKAAFFEAMMDGWVGEGNRRSTETKDDDGYVTITYETEDGRYKVVDRYCTTPLSDKSGGTTTIFGRTDLTWSAVWWMSYGGHYHEEVILFLKKALKKAYKHGKFVGGRGPKTFAQGNLEYHNNPEADRLEKLANDFSGFLGFEFIYNEQFLVVGFHRYFGMSML